MLTNVPFAHGVVPGPGASEILSAWPIDPLLWIAILGSGVLYVAGVKRIKGWPRGRSRCFFGGLVVVFVAVGTPLASYDRVLFSVHMVQHLLLTLIAAPLLVLGSPVALASRASRGWPRAVLLRMTKSRIATVLGHPIVTWLVFTGVLWATHFTPLYDAALDNEFLHIVEHGLYLGSALMFWWPVVGTDPGAHHLPHPARLAYLVLAMPVQTFLGLALYNADGVLYPHYASVVRDWGPTVLDDQRAGALIMWIGSNPVMLAALALVLSDWMRREQR